MNKGKSPFNDKGQRHGLWELYHPNGQLGYKCVYYNGNENGVEEWYWSDGIIYNKTYHL